VVEYPSGVSRLEVHAQGTAYAQDRVESGLCARLQRVIQILSSKATVSGELRHATRTRDVPDGADDFIGVAVLEDLPKVFGDSLIAIEFGNDIEGNGLEGHDSNLLGHGDGPADIRTLRGLVAAHQQEQHGAVADCEIESITAPTSIRISEIPSPSGLTSPRLPASGRSIPTADSRGCFQIPQAGTPLGEFLRLWKSGISRTDCIEFDTNDNPARLECADKFSPAPPPGGSTRPTGCNVPDVHVIVDARFLL
jgi:hypothetical protein